jgi:hypothetical protein
MPDIDFDQESALAVHNRGSRAAWTALGDETIERADRALFRLELACEHYG